MVGLPQEPRDGPCGILDRMHWTTSSLRPLLAGLCMPMLGMSVAVPANAPAAGSTAPPPVAVGHRLPDVAMDGLNGPMRTLSSYRGRPLIINVWASWCGPCRAEAASFERLAWSEAGSRYTIIGVSTDDYRDAALKWLRHSNATLSHYIDHRLRMEHLLGASTIPLTVLVDANGRVVARYRGVRAWDDPESIRWIENAYAAAAKRPKRSP